MDTKVRLYLDQPLAQGQALALNEGQANYLFNVLRLGVGAGVAVFNGRDGEWFAEILETGKRRGLLVTRSLRRPQTRPPDLWLVFAPIKKARMDYLVEKAVELGVSRLVPVQTRYTNAERLRRDKLEAHVIEAAEQCETTWRPEVMDLQPLAQVLAGWDGARRLFWAEERGGGAAGFAAAGSPSVSPAGGAAGALAAILIGPEGGFSEEEKARLRGCPFVTPISLGPRILRAETAAVAALALWQAQCGDWR